MAQIIGNELQMDRCPHCHVATPSLIEIMTAQTSSLIEHNPRRWRGYACSRCGGVVLVATYGGTNGILETYPDIVDIDETIPEMAREYLKQALNSLDTPAGSVMLSASAVDAMLKAKSHKDGTLYSRIEKAAQDHLITVEMAQWAHEIRLDANEPRHADEQSPLPTHDDAQKNVDFAMALAQFLFVLPSRVKRGLTDAKGKSKPKKS